jgi:hypothetical protein
MGGRKDPNPMCTGKVPLKGPDGQMLRDDNSQVLTRACGKHAITGATVCEAHGGNAPQVRAKAAVRAEVMRWGLGDTTVDPGETLLRLVSQSAARADLYARLLEEAYDAADRLKAAHEAQKLVYEADDYDRDDEDGPEPPDVQTAKADLERIFNLGGIAGLVGQTFSATNTGAVFATGEAIRGLARLEAEERDRCASFAAKAVAAGIAERQVRIAEKQAEVLAELIEAALHGAGVTGSAFLAGRKAAANKLRVLQGGAA